MARDRLGTSLFSDRDCLMRDYEGGEQAGMGASYIV